ncbi:MAG: NADPH-dependent 7-cyano-7-deazaguanine reductase QueF [Motiliproteus sp.]|nr:NADPH-dependent 7-cyano-7-deazaguanine reductase QueF [Motiliproteus sp.]MCW9051882.1 NADPH-dependent 7-cyano-7-deazaguanine reductase QueF [Motiliproteus sp.]
MSHDNLHHTPLGRDTEYVSQYDPSQLCPIPRANNWQDRGYDGAPFDGVDIWNAYEVSWLNAKGLPQVAVAEFRVPCDTPHIIESKSFKLYLNSYNLTRFDNPEQVQQQMVKDLSACAGGEVEVAIHDLDHPASFTCLGGECLDHQDIEIEHYQPAPQLLQSQPETEVSEQLYSHLLKSNCPVTGQPDWASIEIHYHGPVIDRAGLLQYLVSYREHGDFHEQCVEQIFMDLLQQCKPTELTVYARYVRRGGLDINPYRSTDRSTGAENKRLVRQ